MNGKHIAFMPYPAFGHTNPVLPVLGELVRRGHEVTCFTTDTFAEKIAAVGARPVRYSAHLDSGPPSDWHTADETAWLPVKLLNQSMAVAPGVEAEFAANPPDLIGYDTTLWAPGRFISWRRKCSSVQLIPTFASNENFSLSGEGMRLIGKEPDDVGPLDPNHPGLVEFVRLMGVHAEEYAVGEEDMLALYHGSREFNLVFVPREFQFGGDTFGEDHAFVGPCQDGGSAGQWQPPADGKPVVLVTLGTTVNHRPDFFRECIRAFAGAPWHVVMTLGGRIDPADLGEIPPNIEVHQWITHAEVLPHASVLVCQAGMGTVLESLYFGVPLVVVPHHPEQKLNTRRLVELGLARELSHATVTAEALRSAVLELAQDVDTRKRVAEMQRYTREAGGAVKAADVIESRLALTGGSDV
ncbi:macrolide family glycosyltransferase [Kutzneria albida]|uniref:Glycosyltransferase n=1 Tax=Kutzneria albida DSM 43870 TaxID=1449976 RepID=W5WFF3_9PSEU|nr:macrolide family glycosyltransferase [Kutzneria albida]AHH99928.1 glycosyltransferase [Kutzneria albida DSM 43870]